MIIVSSVSMLSGMKSGLSVQQVSVYPELDEVSLKHI
jgi:hypothetical protein